MTHFADPPRRRRAVKPQTRHAEPWPDCIEWHMALNAYGYGVRKIAGSLKNVHRLAWEEANGPIPDGMCVLHHCDNRRCYNVEHLFLGTKGDNLRDMAAKGRHVGNRRLSPEQIAAIRASTEPNKDLAARYGVAASTITKYRPMKGTP